MSNYGEKKKYNKDFLKILKLNEEQKYYKISLINLILSKQTNNYQSFFLNDINKDFFNFLIKTDFFNNNNIHFFNRKQLSKLCDYYIIEEDDNTEDDYDYGKKINSLIL